MTRICRSGIPEAAEDLALLVVLQDAGYAGPICFDVKAPRVDEPKDITDVLTVSARNLMWLWERALAVDRGEDRGSTGMRSGLRRLSGYLAGCLYGR